MVDDDISYYLTPNDADFHLKFPVLLCCGVVFFVLINVKVHFKWNQKLMGHK